MYPIKVYDKKGNVTEVHNPSGLPDPTLIEKIEEPYIRASVITATDYIGPIMTLCLGKRGELIKQEYISGNRVELIYDLPLGEIVIDFYDKLKSISKGYASFDYHLHDFRPSKLVKLDDFVKWRVGRRIIYFGRILTMRFRLGGVCVKN